LLEILLAISGIATAVVIFPMVRRVNEAVALGYVALRIVESMIILMGVVSLMSVVTLRDLWGTGVDEGSLTIAGQTLVVFHDMTSCSGRSSAPASATGSFSAT
jgi:hypothetical protein